MKKFLFALGKNSLLLILFFVTVLIFIQIISIMDTRHLDKGDSPHPYFRVAIFNAPDESFRLGSLSEAAECSGNGDCYLIPTKKHGEIKTAEPGYWAYDLLEKNENHSLIRTTANDPDNTFWYTYSIDNDNTITPVKTKMLYFGYMFSATGMAIVCFLLLGRFDPALMAKLPGLSKKGVQGK